MTIGIDAGISATKIVGIKDGEIVAAARIKTGNSAVTLNAAIEDFLCEKNLYKQDVKRVVLTGVGASYIKENLCGLPTLHATEFSADCLGAKHLTKLERMMVVSMGSGTTLLEYSNGEAKHIGGLGMGGSTLVGLSKLLLQTDNIAHVSEMAKEGDISNIDLQIGDISDEEIPGLPAYATAALFGKVKSTASQNDIATGLINTVVQTIASAAILAARNTGIKDFVMIGTLTLLPQCREVFNMMEKLYNVRFHTPKHAEYATAIGAALSNE